jgi:hypothetical protein
MQKLWPPAWYRDPDTGAIKGHGTRLRNSSAATLTTSKACKKRQRDPLGSNNLCSVPTHCLMTEYLPISSLSAWIITRLENRAFQVGIKGVNIIGIFVRIRLEIPPHHAERRLLFGFTSFSADCLRSLSSSFARRLLFLFTALRSSLRSPLLPPRLESDY